MRFKNLPTYLKPREKAYLFGLEKLSDIELLAIILRTGSKNIDVLELSKKIFAQYQNFKQLLSLSYSELGKIYGIGKVKALELKTIFEINKRFNNHITTKIIDLEQVINLSWMQIKSWENEVFVLVLVDKQDNLLYCEALYKTSGSNIVIKPKDIISLVLQRGALKFYCIHNHPSGDVRPSESDSLFTMRLNYLCKVMQIKLIAHLVINQQKEFNII